MILLKKSMLKRKSQKRSPVPSKCRKEDYFTSYCCCANQNKWILFRGGWAYNQLTGHSAYRRQFSVFETYLKNTRFFWFFSTKKKNYLLENTAINWKVCSENSNSPCITIFQESEKKRLSDIVGAGNERYSGLKTFLNYTGTLRIRKISIPVERECTHSMQSWQLVD